MKVKRLKEILNNLDDDLENYIDYIETTGVKDE